jgi:murein DD-endopeptidase MepM/ murein hydrolase activator NlpD
MNILSKTLFISIITFLISCQQKPAEVINKNQLRFNKNNKYNQEKYRKANQNKPSIANSNAKIPLTIDEVSVKEGQTLYSIAKNHDLTLAELIEYNDIPSPYHIKTGDSIKIPSTNYHEVREGETINIVAGLYDLKLEEIIKLNKLQYPYSIYAGDKLKIAKYPTKNLKKDTENINNKNIKESQQINNSTIPNKNSESLKNNNNSKDFNNNSENSQNFANSISDKKNNFAWPIKGKVISQFGSKSAGLFNDGINIEAKQGAKVLASEDGIIAYIGNELKGYGNLVIIKHSQGWITAYAHLEDFKTTKGQIVKKGQVIGTVGTSGKVASPQLYFGLRKGKNAVNPKNYLSKT